MRGCDLRGTPASTRKESWCVMAQAVPVEYLQSVMFMMRRTTKNIYILYMYVYIHMFIWVRKISKFANENARKNTGFGERGVAGSWPRRAHPRPAVPRRAEPPGRNWPDSLLCHSAGGERGAPDVSDES